MMQSLDLETIAGHAGLILLNQGFAFLRRIIGFGEEHAIVSRCLFGFAYAAWLIEDRPRSVRIARYFRLRNCTNLGFLCWCFRCDRNRRLFNWAWKSTVSDGSPIVLNKRRKTEMQAYRWTNQKATTLCEE
jgi:hypothetical protein